MKDIALCLLGGIFSIILSTLLLKPFLILLLLAVIWLAISFFEELFFHNFQ